MSLSLPSRYAFFSGSTPVRISRSSSLCFAVTSVRPYRWNTVSFPQPIFLRHVTSTGSNFEINWNCGAHASLIGSYEDSSSYTDTISTSYNLGSFISFAEALCIISRHLEKLGIRFRVTRKSLKEPISETAALAQKNSEATRVLAAQQEILEKELVEIQKVLLAMQEQQRKQLELILTIAKNAKLFER